MSTGDTDCIVQVVHYSVLQIAVHYSVLQIAVQYSTVPYSKVQYSTVNPDIYPSVGHVCEDRPRWNQTLPAMISQ